MTIIASIILASAAFAALATIALCVSGKWDRIVEIMEQVHASARPAQERIVTVHPLRASHRTIATGASAASARVVAFRPAPRILCDDLPMAA